MPSKPSSRSSSSGFTLLELMVAAVLGLLIGAMCVNSALVQRRVFAGDSVRTRLNQNLRGALDVIVSDGRVAGENLSAALPAVELAAGGGGPDELVLRRNLSSSVLNLCTAISAGSSISQIYFANSATAAGCIYSAEAPKYSAWRAYRLAHGGSVAAFIYDPAKRKGEFFVYAGEGSSSTRYWITRSAGSFTGAYPKGSWIYLLEEWRYRLAGDVLQVVENGRSAAPYNVGFGFTGFAAEVLLQDGSGRTSFGGGDDWTKIRRIALTLSAAERFEHGVMTRTSGAHFFPRNVLSN